MEVRVFLSIDKYYRNLVVSFRWQNRLIFRISNSIFGCENVKSTFCVQIQIDVWDRARNGRTKQRNQFIGININTDRPWRSESEFHSYTYGIIRSSVSVDFFLFVSVIAGCMASSTTKIVNDHNERKLVFVIHCICAKWGRCAVNCVEFKRFSVRFWYFHFILSWIAAWVTDRVKGRQWQYNAISLSCFCVLWFGEYDIGHHRWCNFYCLFRCCCVFIIRMWWPKFHEEVKCCCWLNQTITRRRMGAGVNC